MNEKDLIIQNWIKNGVPADICDSYERYMECKQPGFAKYEVTCRMPIKIRPDREFKFHVFKEQVDYPHRMMLKLGVKHIYEYSIGKHLIEEPMVELPK
jgi:hypothetical protein